MDRVIFLDVDGPLIPSGMYLINRHCSFERQCSPIPIAIINRLCKETGAKIVMNSSHNYADSITDADYRKVSGNVKEDLISEGILAAYFHKRWRTQYPNPVGMRFSEYSYRRYRAIKNWQQEHGEVDWVCFDDEPFLNSKDEDYKRLIVVDFDTGITPVHANMALDVWKDGHKVFIL